MILRQTFAMLLDAYRELNARKLFWISLALSGFLVAALATLGINETGLTFLHWSIPYEFVGSLYEGGILDEATFYKFLFFTIGINIWLAWGSLILAIISTASLMPDFVSSGAIELSLSKPIGRLRLFLTKYCTALLFVGLQTLIFSVAAILVIGLRGGEWVFTLLLTAPLLMLVFSFLYCISALVGMITRSAIAAIITVLVIWACIWAVNTTERVILTFKVSQEVLLDLQIQQQTIAQANLDKAAPDAPNLAKLREDLDRWSPRIENSTSALTTLRRVHAVSFAVKCLLPKTGESMELLGRTIITGPEIERFRASQEARNTRSMNDPGKDGVRVSERMVEREVDKALESRGVVWTLGTSIAFEVVVLAIAAWIFRRRDF
jgi:ABC-type transport system involved in multi-copper enzyme maturation permease subunit